MPRRWIPAGTLPFGFAALACLAAGCGGPTNADVIAEFTPQITPLRAKVQAIGQAVQQEPPVVQDAAEPGAAPPPVFGADATAGNLAVLNLEEALDPDAERPFGTTLDFGLYDDNDLRDALVYCGPKCPWQGAALRQPGESFAGECQRALQLQYLLVVRIERYDPPMATSDSEFVGGTARIEGFLVRLSDAQIVARAAAELGPVAEVEFDVIQGGGRNDDPRERMTAHVRSALWSEGKRKLSQALESLVPGADVDLTAR